MRSEILKKTLLVFLLARDAMPRPRNCFEAFLVYLFLTIDAQPEFRCLYPPESFVNQLKNRPIRVGLPEQEFLRVRIGGFVRQIDRWIIIGLTPFLLRASYVTQQLFPPGR